MSNTNDQAQNTGAQQAPDTTINNVAASAPAPVAASTPPAEVKAEQAAAPKPQVKTNTPTPTVTSTQQPKTVQPPVTQETWDTLVAKVMSGQSTEQKSVVNTLAQYITEMKPGTVITTATIDQNQKRLYRLFEYIIDKTEDFNACFQILVKAWNFNSGDRGVFHEQFWSRGMEHVNLKADERTSFRAICNLLSILSDVKGRGTILKHVDMEKTFAKGFSEQGKAKVITYVNKFKS